MATRGAPNNFVVYKFMWCREVIIYIALDHAPQMGAKLICGVIVVY